MSTATNTTPTTAAPALHIVPTFTPPQYIDRARIPKYYEVWADGVYKVDTGDESQEVIAAVRETPALDLRPSATWRAYLKKICEQPVWISGFARVASTPNGEELVELSFIRAGTFTVVQHWASRLDISEQRRLVGLASAGIPVRTGNSAQMEAYFNKCFATNIGQLTELNVVTRSGSFSFGTPPVHGWMLGREWIGPTHAGQVVFDPRLRSATSTDFGRTGDKNLWWEKYDELVGKGPIIRLLIDSTFAAPILRTLRVRTFIMHHWAASGSGKTALAKFAMSAWGDPVKLTKSFNGTDLSFVENFREVSDLPVAFDELQSSRTKDLSKVIYAIVLETGRARSNQYGGLAETQEGWRTMARTTGEVPLLGRGGQDVGGQSNRVLEINEALLTPREAGELHRWMYDENYGHSGNWFLWKVINRLNGTQRDLAHIPDFTARLHKIFRRLVAQLQTEYASLSGRVEAIAAIGAASLLVRYWRAEQAQNIMIGAEHEAARDLLWDNCVTAVTADCLALAASVTHSEDESTSTPIHERAIALLKDDLAAHPARWLDTDETADSHILFHGTAHNIAGVIRREKDEVWVIPAEGKRLWESHDIPSSRVLSDLRDRGVLVATEKGRKTLHREYGKLKSRVWVFKLSAFS